jgi:hypothetical protein
VRTHDGFYLRFGFNVGYAFDAAELPGATAESHGLGGFIEYAVGANVTRQAVLAFTHYTVGLLSPHTTVNDRERTDDHTDLFQHMGVLLDFYPTPASGWHAGGSIGVGTANIGTEEDEGTDQGFAASVGGGYDAWVGDQGSLGVMARVLYINGASDEFGEHRAFIPMLAFTALLH